VDFTPGFCMCYNLVDSPGESSQFRNLLRAVEVRVRTPVGARFSVHVQSYPGDHPACRIFLRAKTTWAWLWPPTPSSAKFKERV